MAITGILAESARFGVAQKPQPSGKAVWAPAEASQTRILVIFTRPLARFSGAGIGLLVRFHERKCASVQVLVRDNNVDQALRALKKKMQREGLFREMKIRRNYEKPSERRAREKAEAVRRYRKLLRKRMEREGY